MEILQSGYQARRAVWRERGGVAIMFGLTLVVLIGFAGLVIDLGRFFVIKAELQNAMDACALSAASQLKPGAGDPNALVRAVAYGQVFITGPQSIQNRVNFQSIPLDAQILQITFATANGGPYQGLADADPNTAKFVKCAYSLAGLPVYLMRVLNAVSTQEVGAMAVATRDEPTAPCLPVAVCSSTPTAPNFGYTIGQWMSALDGSSLDYGTGHFGWASLLAPGSDKQIKDALTGNTQCDISGPSQTVHGTGVKAGLSKEWNTRFGVYAPSMNPATAPPDHTGYAYSDTADTTKGKPSKTVPNWTPAPGFNAYSGVPPLVPSGVQNYVGAYGVNRGYDTTAPQPPGFPVSQYPTILGSAQLADLGRSNRRVVAAPVVDCSVWNVKPPAVKNLPVLGWACVLMLNPYDDSGAPSSPSYTAKLEFRGRASDAGSPCAGGSEFAIAPVLTQ